MTIQATPGRDDNRRGGVVYMALELSARRWKVLFGCGGRTRGPIDVAAGDVERLLAAIVSAKVRFGVAEAAPVVSCYEAGRDGFWLDRALRARGIENLVVDSSSIEVPRRARRAKSDRLDVGKLLELLLRHGRGETGVWSVVRVPDENAEDVRRLTRELEHLKGERKRAITRMKSLLATVGVADAPLGGRAWETRWDAWLAAVRLWNGQPLPAYLRYDLSRQGRRLALVEVQIAEAKAERERLASEAREPAAQIAVRLQELKAIGPESAWVFAGELFGWRRFANRRELAAAAGLTPTPHASGDSRREQGLAKSGNGRVRTMLVEIAWCWLRYQPQSALSAWYRRRFADGGGRARRVGLVALARKLLVALWRYLGDGVLPDGAELKPARA